MKQWTVRGVKNRWEFISWPVPGEKEEILTLVEKSECEHDRAKLIGALKEITRIHQDVQYSDEHMDAIVLARKILKEIGE